MDLSGPGIDIKLKERKKRLEQDFSFCEELFLELGSQFH